MIGIKTHLGKIVSNMDINITGKDREYWSEMLVDEPLQWETFHKLPEWSNYHNKTATKRASTLLSNLFDVSTIPIQNDLQEDIRYDLIPYNTYFIKLQKGIVKGIHVKYLTKFSRKNIDFIISELQKRTHEGLHFILYDKKLGLKILRKKLKDEFYDLSNTFTLTHYHRFSEVGK